MVCIFRCSSAIKVHVSEAYRTIDTTSARNSLIALLGVIFSHNHIVFSIASVTEACEFLERTCRYDHCFNSVARRYLKFCR